MARAGWDIPAPAASMFAWAPIPEKFRETGSLEFSKQLLAHAKVAVSPGIGFGEYGEGYVRIALVENEHRIRQAARNVKRFLSMRREHAGRPATGKRAMTAPLKIAIAGLGTVGGGVAHLLLTHGEELAERAGRRLELVAVSARAIA